MKNTVILLIVLTICLSLCSCSKSVLYDEQTFFAADTVINIYSGKTGTDHNTDCRDIVQMIEEKLSRTIEGSDVYILNESETGSLNMYKDTRRLISLSKQLYESTGGAFDISIEPLVELWNINGGNTEIPAEEDIQTALEKLGLDALTPEELGYVKSSPDLRIDLGGIAKGYICGECVSYLKGDGEYGMVDIGGNIGVYGNKPDGSLWKIAIKDPFDTEKSIGYLTVDKGFVAVSGDYERFFEKDGVRYHHILDPGTGYPVNNGVHQVAVYTKDNGELGDGLSSALFVMGVDRSLEFYDKGEYEFEALFVTDDGIVMTEGMKELFTLAEE